MTTIGSLFAGGGGLDRGVEAALAARVLWQVELDDYPRSILERYWPEADRSVTDVKQAGRATLPPVDVLIGGFPCQDLSPAGSRRGLAGARSGLAFEMLRVVEELAPRLLITENTYHRWRAWVPELRGRLWALGYTSVPVHVSAAEVGAPHRRGRCFVVAWSAADADRLALRQLAERGPRGWEGLVRRKGEAEPGHDGGARAAADAAGARLAEREGVAGHHVEELAPPVRGGWWAPVPPVRRGDDGLAGVDVRARRRRDRRRLTLLGNAVVPQAGYVAAVRAKELVREWLG